MSGSSGALPADRNGRPAEPSRIRVVIDPVLRELVPVFLSHTREKIAGLSEAISQKDWERLATIAHQLKGIGGAYGFDGISDIGRRLEAATANQNAAGVRENISSLAFYLDHLDLVDE